MLTKKEAAPWEDWDEDKYCSIVPPIVDYAIKKQAAHCGIIRINQTLSAYSFMTEQGFCLYHCSSNCILNAPQDTACHRLEADTAVSPTAAIYTCLEVTIQILRKRVDRRMKTTLFSESYGAFILPQPPGSRFAQRVTCPSSWPPCQVWTNL